MYETEHRFFASALAVSLAACVAFSAALSLVPTQKAYADASGFESGVLSLLNSIYTYQQWIYGSVGDASGNPTLTESNEAIAYTLDSIYTRMGQLTTNNTYMKDLRDALAADSMTINGQTFKTPRGYLNDIANRSDSMSSILLAWNRDMGASLNGTATDATWFSNVSSRLLAMINAINSANTNLISIDSKFWEYFMIPQRFQQQDGSYLYTPAYYLQYEKATYDDLLKMLLTNTDLTVNGTSYKTPRYYLQRFYTLFQSMENDLVDIDDFLSSINNKLIISNQSVAAILRNIYDELTGLDFSGDVYVDMTSTNQILNQIKSLLDDIKSYLAPELPNVADAVIGDFDTDGFDENMSTLKDDLASLAVFGSVYSLGLYVATMDDVNAIQAPVLVVPFEFAGSDDVVTLDFTWLDDIRPMINYVLLFSLFIGLTTWSINLIKE